MPSRNKIPIHRNDYRPYYSHCNAHSHWTPMANAFHSSPIHPAISPLASSCCCFLPFLSSSFFDTCTSSKTVLPLLARPYRKLITTSRLKFPHPFTWMQHFITCACHPFSLLCFDWFFFFCIATFSNLHSPFSLHPLASCFDDLISTRLMAISRYSWAPCMCACAWDSYSTALACH